MESKSKRIAIIGGGPVGALNACFLARRGFQVDLYELRDDIRKVGCVRGRSINLSLSCRGREALKRVGLEDVVTRNGLAMYARMIHDLNGNTRPIPYGTKDQYIMSIDRPKLNGILLTSAEEYSNVNIHFGHKLQTCKYDKGEMTFKLDTGEMKTATADAIIGCDGAYSAARTQMMRQTRMDFSQEYITHGYMELCIPPTKDGKFAMPINYLHIWARETFMMIALPNVTENSFVVTLFMPFDMFDEIKTNEDLMNFFRDNFPDSIPLIGEKFLQELYFSAKPLSLLTVKCNPYHIRGDGLLMGDAAHAMVPFYGQGMNCGFEDCIILDDLMEKLNNDLDKCLPLYTEARHEDAKAICDLALMNYVELRSAVNSKKYLFRKKLDAVLQKVMPSTWTPLYTMVSFTRTRYTHCVKNRSWQDQVLKKTILTTAVMTGIGGAAAVCFLKSPTITTFTESLINKLNSVVKVK